MVDWYVLHYSMSVIQVLIIYKQVVHLLVDTIAEDVE